MKMSDSALFLTVALFAMTFQPVAAAPVWKEGYVCSVNYFIQNNVLYGQPLHLSAIIKTQPHCGGANVLTAFFKHYGGTAKGNNFSRAELLTHLEMLQQAAIHGAKVQFFMDDEVNSAVYTARFFGN